MRRIRKRYHELMGEMYGRIAGRALRRLGIHALWIDDELTFERVRAVLNVGVEVGWCEGNETRHVRANRASRSLYPLPYARHALIGEAWTARMLSENPEIGAETRNAYLWAEEQFLRIARGDVGERDLIG